MAQESAAGLSLEIEDLIAQRAVVDHPFVAALEQGAFSREQLAAVAEQMLWFFNNINKASGAMYMICDDYRLRRVIVDGLIDEETAMRCGSASHFEISWKYAHALGIDVDACVQQLIDGTFRVNPILERAVNEEIRLCRTHVMVGIAAAVADESQSPALYRRIVPPLRDIYGLDDDALEVWTLHIEADEGHGEAGLELLTDWATTPERREMARGWIVSIRDLVWEAWDGYLDHATAVAVATT